MKKLTVNIKTAPTTSIYPVRSLGSNVGFNLLIKIKLNACIAIDKKIKISPLEKEDNPSPLASDVVTIPINPIKNPNIRNFDICCRNNKIANNIVTSGAQPKIIDPFHQKFFVNQIAKNV